MLGFFFHSCGLLDFTYFTTKLGTFWILNCKMVEVACAGSADYKETATP